MNRICPAANRFCSPLRSLVGISTAHLFLNIRWIIAVVSTPASLLKTYAEASGARIRPPRENTCEAKFEASWRNAQPYLFAAGSLALQAASSQVFQSFGGSL